MFMTVSIGKKEFIRNLNIRILLKPWKLFDWIFLCNRARQSTAVKSMGGSQMVKRMEARVGKLRREIIALSSSQCSISQLRIRRPNRVASASLAAARPMPTKSSTRRIYSRASISSRSSGSRWMATTSKSRMATNKLAAIFWNQNRSLIRVEIRRYWITILRAQNTRRIRHHTHPLAHQLFVYRLKSQIKDVITRQRLLCLPRNQLCGQIITTLAPHSDQSTHLQRQVQPTTIHNLLSQKDIQMAKIEPYLKVKWRE